MTTRKIVGGILGGLVGAFAGAVIGANCSIYFPRDFTFLGEHGYEAVGALGLLLGCVVMGMLGAFLAGTAFKK